MIIMFPSRSALNEFKRFLVGKGWPAFEDEYLTVFNGTHTVKEGHVRLLNPIQIVMQWIHKPKDESIKRELLQRLEKR